MSIKITSIPFLIKANVDLCIHIVVLSSSTPVTILFAYKMFTQLLSTYLCTYFLKYVGKNVHT